MSRKKVLFVDYDDDSSMHIILLLFAPAMLRWFVEDDIVKEVLKNPGKCLIEEEDVEARPEMLPDAVLDENVDVHLIRKFFSYDGWLAVTTVFEQKQRNRLLMCVGFAFMI